MEDRHSNHEPERKDETGSSAVIGDDRHFYIGPTLSPSDSVVFFDPTLPLRQNSSCCLVVGEPGGRGKNDAVRSSHRTSKGSSVDDYAPTIEGGGSHA